MGAAAGMVPDDRVLRSTRLLSGFIAPFLIGAFVLLYGFPSDTGRLFAWTITPTLTPMVLASAYLGGFYFFIRALWEPRWASLRLGLVAVAVFATLLGVATVVHWDRFNHAHVAFWLWAGLYFTAPFLVVGAYVANRAWSAPPQPSEPRLGRVAQLVVAVFGAAALITGLTMFIVPVLIIPIWPWALTPLTCRVVGAIFCLGCAGIGAALDPRWIALRLMTQVEVVMVTLILIAALRAPGDFYPGRPLTWLLLAGFLALLAGSAYLWLVQEIAPKRHTHDTNETPTTTGGEER